MGVTKDSPNFWVKIENFVLTSFGVVLSFINDGMTNDL